MNRRSRIVTLTVIVLVALVYWLARRFPERFPNIMWPTGAASKSSSPTIPLEENERPAGGAYQGLSDARWQWWNKMKEQDRSFEWKMPIKFYGKVVDQDNRPVSAALIRYGWNAVDGSHQKSMKSDDGGRGLSPKKRTGSAQVSLVMVCCFGSGR